jgi:hypothetical protein
MEQGYDNASRWFVGVMESHWTYLNTYESYTVAKTD